MTLARDGFACFPPDPRVAAWAAAAHTCATRLASDPAMRAAHLRHGATWFVGVDALPNTPDGSLDGVPLAGPWQAHVPDLPQHRAQVSIIYPGYPQQDPGQSDANHRYRQRRAAAHVDGLLPIGPDRRRYAREFHAYILGVPLNTCDAAPTLVWPGSHKIIGPALRAAIGAADPRTVDVTEAYQDARREVFAKCDPVPLAAPPGASFLIHRHALHGTAPWGDSPPLAEGRMIAFLRPEFPSAQLWLAPD